MSDHKLLPNRLGMARWLGSTHGIEGYVFLLHRLSGLVLLLFLIAHIALSSSRLFGMETWAQMMTIARSPTIELLKYPVFVAFAFHAFNGIRLILVELGFAVGRNERLVYPYRGSIRKQRPLLIVMMILTAVLLVVGEFDVLRLSH